MNITKQKLTQKQKTSIVRGKEEAQDKGCTKL